MYPPNLVCREYNNIHLKNYGQSHNYNSNLYYTTCINFNNDVHVLLPQLGTKYLSRCPIEAARNGSSNSNSLLTKFRTVLSVHLWCSFHLSTGPCKKSGWWNTFKLLQHFFHLKCAEIIPIWMPWRNFLSSMYLDGEKSYTCMYEIWLICIEKIFPPFFSFIILFKI